MTDGVEFDEEVVAALEDLYQTASMAERRRRIREALALEPGEQVLSVGCGPGFESRELAKDVGEAGRVHGVDTAAPMLAVARERCADLPQTTFEAADATDLPVEAGAFDAAAAVQVYEYVPDLETAFASLSRALKPGGRAVVFDSDWATMRYHAADRERSDRILAAFDAHCPYPFLARTLRPRLVQAGFEVTAAEPFVHFETELDDNSVGGAMLDPIADFVGEETDVDETTVAAWVDDVRERGEAGEFFFSFTQFLFVAELPPTEA